MIKRRRSKIHQWGVFATQSIHKNTHIVDYAGEKISNQESLRRERRYINNGQHIWCFKLTNRSVIDAGVDDSAVRQIEAPDVLPVVDVAPLAPQALLVGDLFARVVDDASVLGDA